MALFSLLVFVILSSISLVNSVCSGNEKSACGNDCFWISGVCKAFEASDCQLPGCPAGCVYAAAVPTTCVDTTAEACASSGSCDDTSNCEISDGTCSLSSSPTCVIEDPSVDNCPAGCSSERTVLCEPQPDTLPGCELSAEPLTTCDYQSDCHWTGTKCEGRDGFCEMMIGNGSVASECTMETNHFCKISGGTCVYDLTQYTSYCNQLPTAECTRENTDGICSVKDGTCTFDHNDLCAITPLNDCYGPCRISASNTCVFNGAYCSALSTEPISACSRVPSCKVEGGVCKEKTKAELCRAESVARFADCDLHENCKEEGGKCVSLRTENIEECKTYSAEKILSNCSLSKNRCQIDGESGECVPRVPVCRLNAAGTQCDPNNLVEDNCVEKYQYSCHINDHCSGEVVDTTCDDISGCEWSSTGTCVAKSPLNCVVTGGSCTPNTCTLNTGTSSSCTVGPVTDGNCGGIKGVAACKGVTGCKWAAVGGTCIEKNCSNSPSYALCCQDASCAYCSADPRPVDCPSVCATAPSSAECCATGASYANCCTNASCEYCSVDPQPSDCPPTEPNAGVNVHAAILLLIAALFVGWF